MDNISLRVVRFKISPGCFENIITNLPVHEFDFEDFKELYHLRWGEENAFRDLKALSYPFKLTASRAIHAVLNPSGFLS